MIGRIKQKRPSPREWRVLCNQYATHTHTHTLTNKTDYANVVLLTTFILFIKSLATD